MIYSTITDEYHFWDWIKHSDSYGNNFSLEGAKAVQAWFEELSEETPEGMVEFDPIAWCVEFSEYDSLGEFNTQYWGEGKNENMFQSIEELQEETTVIELENGHIIVEEF